jgi:hypothetical protein
MDMALGLFAPTEKIFGMNLLRIDGHL